jgi:multidrug resistance efflux pump
MKPTFLPMISTVILILALSACTPKPAAAEQATTPAGAETIIAEGRLLPVSSLDLSFSVAGQVADVLVKEGDRVRSGQVLARLADSPEAQSALAGAEKEALAAQQALDDYKAAADVNLAQGKIAAILAKKQLTTARDNYFAGKSTEAKARMDEAAGKLAIAENDLKQLTDNAGLDPDQINTLEARLGAANAAVESARAAVDALELRATMTGTAADIRILPGQRMSAGEVVMAVADFSEWVVETDNLTEVEVVNVKEGQAVEIILDALPDAPLQGMVSSINARFEEKRGDTTYTVTVVLNETHPLMRWGMTAAVRFAP